MERMASEVPVHSEQAMPTHDSASASVSSSIHTGSPQRAQSRTIAESVRSAASDTRKATKYAPLGRRCAPGTAESVTGVPRHAA